jgi:exosortase
VVPVFAAFLVWHRRERFQSKGFAPSWWSVPVLGLGLALHLAGAYLYFDWFSAASLLLVLAGIVLAAGGLQSLAWTWPAIAFLAFMLPLPFRVEHALGYRLQSLAAVTSTYMLQTLGFAAVAEGNTVLLGDMRLDVMEACSGLGMLVTFFAMAVAVAMLLKRPILDKAVVVLSAIPIAVAANVLRIVITGILGHFFGAELAGYVFHDLAGWIMMPLALAMLWLVAELLARLLVEPVEQRPVFSLAEVHPAKQTAKREHQRGASSTGGALDTALLR